MNHFLRWSVLTTALVAVLGVSSGTAHGQGSLPATKVGTVNIGLLFTKYNQAIVLKRQLESDIGPLKKKAEEVKDIMRQHEEWLKKNPDTSKPEIAQQAEKSRRAMVDGKRALEDMEVQARNLVGKKQESQLIQLYKEIHAGVQMYAQQNGYHVVFAYGDPADQDQFSFQNITRKMNAMDMGAAVPFYAQNGLDISNEVLARLNASVPAPPPPVIQPTGGTK